MLKVKKKVLTSFFLIFFNILKPKNNKIFHPSIKQNKLQASDKCGLERRIKINWTSSRAKKICLKDTTKPSLTHRKHKAISRDLECLSILTVTDLNDQIFYLTDHILPFNTQLTQKQKQSFNILYATILASNPPIYDLRSWKDKLELAQKKIISIRPYWYQGKLQWLSYIDEIKKIVLHSADSLGGLLCRLIESYPIPNFKPVIFLGFIGEEEARIFRQSFTQYFFPCDIEGNAIQESVDLVTPEENLFLRYTSFMDFFRVTNTVREQIKEKGFRTISLIIPNFSGNNELGRLLKKGNLVGTPIYHFKDNDIDKINYTIKNPADDIEYTMLSFKKSHLIKVFKYFSDKKDPIHLPEIEVNTLESYIFKITDPDWKYTSLYIIPPVDFLN